ncbi:MAG: tyrosine-type recombinase/integrase, partial [Candidatus Promineifilaceae bacterium]|nr:tyrosine-type recombinase/integrase [Candidatus Promineifilaceae bacterium]
TISLPAHLCEILQVHQATTGGEEGLVFTTSTGNPVSQRNLTRHFHSQLEKLGLPRMRFHDLRHTAATLLLQAEVHPKVVQDMLGHSSIVLTLDTYSHVIPGIQEQAAEKMDAIFQ